MTVALPSPISPSMPIPPTRSPTATAAAARDAGSIQRAAQEFEAMAVGQMLAPMFQTVDTAKGAFGGGSGEEAWKPMMVAELGKQVAKGGGIGLARPVMEQMLRLQEARNEPGGAQVPPTPNPPEQNHFEQLMLEQPTLRRTTLQQAITRPGA